MRKRFIIGLDSTTKEQNEAFLEFVKEHGVGWWHWLGNFWLLADSGGRFSADDVRNKLKETHPGVHTLVIELSEHGDTWAGYGPKSENRNMFKWLRETWSKR